MALTKALSFRVGQNRVLNCTTDIAKNLILSSLRGTRDDGASAFIPDVKSFSAAMTCFNEHVRKTEPFIINKYSTIINKIIILSVGRFL